MASFNFGTFMQNFGQVAATSAQIVDAKAQDNKSLHASDWMHIGIMGVMAILSAVEPAKKPEGQ